MEWTEELPENCPPADAEPPSGSVVRLVNNDPPADADFLSLAELNPSKIWNDDELDCQSRGLSVYRDRADALRTKARIPALRGRLLAEADIAGEAGLIKATPPARDPKSSHHTWWIPTNTQISGVFSVDGET